MQQKFNPSHGKKKGAGTMHIKVESQILTWGPQHKSLLLQEAPGTLLKSTQGNAVLGLRQGLHA